MTGATEHVDAWAGFLVSTKLEGYRADMSPGTHPIRGDVPDVAQAMANFDAITYAKGESVLKQLAAYVGEDAFVAGLRAYFREHAWSNTTLDDLMDAVGAAAGRDLTDWTTAWLDRAGTDTIRLAEGGLRVESPDADPPRPHHLRIRSFAASPSGLSEVGSVDVETVGDRAEVALPDADLHLVNADDLTFAATRPDEESVRILIERAGDLPDPISRALAGATVWDMLVKGECTAGDVVATLTRALATETSPIVVESFLGLATRAAEQWAPTDRIPGLLADVAATAVGLTDHDEFRQPALRALAASATSADHFDLLRDPAEEDRDLGWRVLARRAELGDYDEAAVTALQDADPDPEAWVRALGVSAARPDERAKEDAWQAMMVDRRVPAGAPLIQLAGLFWRPTQADLLEPFTERYLDALPGLTSGGLLMAGSLIRALFPLAVADQEFLNRALKMANAPRTHPAVRQNLLVGADTVRRMLLTRGRD
jgi:aminopeptidase N